MTTSTKDLEYYLAIPYILAIESIEGPDGQWVRRAEYPELPDCAAEAFSAVEAIEKVDEQRVETIRRLLQQGKPVPEPRPPLLSSGSPLDPERLGFARWLVDEGRLTDR